MRKLVKDPVCGMEINPDEINENLFSAVYKEKKYYFCSPFCKAAFVEDPEKFIVAEPENNKIDL